MAMTSLLFLSLIGLLIMLISGHHALMRKINTPVKQTLKSFKQNGSLQMTLGNSLCFSLAGCRAEIFGFV
jgi:hypothetical protein